MVLKLTPREGKNMQLNNSLTRCEYCNVPLFPNSKRIAPNQKHLFCCDSHRSLFRMGRVLCQSCGEKSMKKNNLVCRSCHKKDRPKPIDS